MSLSVSLDKGDTVEWSTTILQEMFAKNKTANQRQALNPSFFGFLLELIRFNRQAPELLQLDEDDPRRNVTTAQYLRDNNYSETFFAYYLLPVIAATWSAKAEDALAFPAAQLFTFFRNHKLFELHVSIPVWKTVKGQSLQYVEVVQSILGDAVVHLSTPIMPFLCKTTAVISSTRRLRMGAPVQWKESLMK